MGEVIQLQGDHRLKIKDFLIDNTEGLGLDEKTIKVRIVNRTCRRLRTHTNHPIDPRLLRRACL
jgi:translation initiation factor 1 (eIF-1/SUI1)